MRQIVYFVVLGTPQPQGSTRAFIPRGWKRPIVTSANAKLKPWRSTISELAMFEMQGKIMSETAIKANCKFFFAKPKSAKKSITQKITKPDADKLLRGVFDALTGIVFRDDSQVVAIEAYKFFGVPERTEIEVLECEEERV